MNLKLENRTNFAIIDVVIIMNELLAPAGDLESLYAAISNGADAIYLGLDSFSARAYAKNFNKEDLEIAIKYAHLRNVKVYVTMNTLIYEDELEKAYAAIKRAYLANVDGLIIQDLALLTHTINYYPQMEAHTSTQLGIDDIYGIKLLEKLGVKRVVLARENSIEQINSFKKQTKMPLEVFIHGALCVSYSGGCLMSGLIGMRSGNRGRCVGPCRKQYKLINSTTDEIISNTYILSMKDLNSLDNIDKLKNIDSLKIEGRMKSPEYVASIVRSYRDKLDGKKTTSLELEKIFNRTFTKGYLFNEDKKDITNPIRPNNNGYYIGKITGIKKDFYEITLENPINQGDQLRIDSKNEINIPATKIYDKNLNYVNSASNKCYLKINEKAAIGDLVYKTKDKLFMEEIQKTYPLEFKRLPLDFYVEGEANKPLSITVKYEGYYVTKESNILDSAINKPISKEAITNQINKLQDTPYFLNDITFNIKENFFIPIKEINNLRRELINELNLKRLVQREIDNINIDNKPIAFDKISPKLAVFATTQEQYQAALDEGIEIIYYKNYARRNNVDFKKVEGDYILVGGYNSLEYFKNKTLISDHILNATNSITVYNLYKLGIHRTTLSHEINKSQIKQLYDAYVKNNNGAPNLEMIVYGHQELMYTKYCPLKKNNLCGKCKNNRYYLDDGMYQFPIISYDDCTTSILNGKILNLIDDLNDLQNYINVFRVQLTIEDYQKSKEIIKMFKNKMNHLNEETNFFDKKTNTRGNLNREII